MPRLWFALLTLVLLTALPASAQQGEQRPASDGRSSAGASLVLEQPPQLRASTFSRLLDLAAQQPTVRVIVGLDVPFRREAELTSAQVAGQRQALATAQDAVVTALDAPADVTRYAFVPFAAMEVDRADLQRLQASPLVVSIQEDIPVPPTALSPAPLQQSVPLIGADAAWDQGYAGGGWSVAILDTGVDAGHPFLSEKVVAEACFSTTNGSTSTSVCPNGQNTQVGPGAGASCDASVAGCDHGTHVAGIAAGTGSTFSGVARDASLIAVQVFSEFPIGSSYCSGPGPCVLSYTSDQIEGLEYVYSLRTTLDVASSNMSLGGGQYTATCDAEQSATKAAIDQLLSVDIATAIASGNNGYANATGSPGCISSAVTVGSTTKTDGVSSFSNTAPWVDVLAPGSAIYSSVPGTGFAYKNGTSMATPHVAGALAILRQAYPAEPAADLLDRLTTTGVPIAAGTPSQDYPRIQIDDALGEGGGAPEIVVTPASLSQELPVGASATQTLTIENTGDAALTFDIGFVAGATASRPAHGRRTPSGGAHRTLRRGEPAARTPSSRSLLARPSVREDTPRAGYAPTNAEAEQVADGSFEAGTPNPYWDEASAEFGTPLCDTALCGTDAPYSGTWWAWFGGTANEEVASLSQDVVIPTGDAELSFFLEVAAESPGFLEVRLDGDVVFHADQSDQAAYSFYAPVVLDVSAYADGGTHTLEFYYESSAGAIANFFVDAVSLTSSPSGPAWLSVAPSSGTVAPGSSASVTVSYDASSLEVGQYSATLSIDSNDPSTPVVTVPVTLTVSGDNQPPVVTDDAATTDEDEAVTVDVLANDADPDGDALTVAEVSAPSNGTASDNGDGTVTYTPAADFFGEDTFTYTVSDGNGGAATATVTVTIAPVNDAPVAADDDATTDENESVTVDVLANDTDTEGDALSVFAVTQPQNGNAAATDDGTVTYTPAADFFGADAFTYTVSDGNGGTDEATVTLTITAVNDAPVFESDPVTSADEGEPYLYVVVVSDAEGDALTISASALPAWLSFTDNGDGTATLSGTPSAEDEGTYAVTLAASDGELEAEQAFEIAVGAVNQPPVAADDATTTDEDEAVSVAVLANDTDPDGDDLAVTDVSAPSNGTADDNGGGTVTYTPAADFFGEDTFTYTISDGNGGEATASVTVTVSPVNDAPSASSITDPEDGAAITLAGDPEAPVTVAWTAATDAEGDAVSYRWEAALADGDFSSPLLTAETDAPSFETTNGALDAALAAAGVEPGESAAVEHRVVASDGEAETPGPVATVMLTRGVLTDAEAGSVPTVFAVGGTYPNPSGGAAWVAVDLPWSAEVTVEVYDTAGRQVALRTKTLSPGRGRSIALDDLALRTGVYVYRLRAASPAGTEVATGRFTVVR